MQDAKRAEIMSFCFYSVWAAVTRNKRSYAKRNATSTSRVVNGDRPRVAGCVALEKALRMDL